MVGWKKFIRGVAGVAFGRVIGAFVVAILVATGIWPILVAIMMSIIISVWAFVTGFPLVIIILIMLATIWLVLGIICFILFLRRNRRKIPVTIISLSDEEFRRWSTTDPLALWQAASLWMGFNPHLDIQRFDSTGYWIFTKLLRAVEKEEIDVINHFDDTKFCHLSLDALRKYAIKIGERPKFLFAYVDRHNNEAVDQIRRDIAKLADMLLDYRSYSEQRTDIGERMNRLRDSDHLILDVQPIKQLLRDFLNLVGRAADCKKKL